MWTSPPTEEMLRIVPLVFRRRGPKAWIMVRVPQKFTSKSFFPSSSDASSRGIVYPTPELLTRMSKPLPSVLASTALTAVTMDSMDVTSRVRMVTLGMEARWEAFEGVRTAAKTWRPRFWKATDRAEPIPPALVPVMRTVLGDIGVV